MLAVKLCVAGLEVDVRNVEDVYALEKGFRGYWVNIFNTIQNIGGHESSQSVSCVIRRPKPIKEGGTLWQGILGLYI